MEDLFLRNLGIKEYCYGGILFLRILGIIGFSATGVAGFWGCSHECGIPKYLDYLEFFSMEGLGLRNLGREEFVLWRDFISTAFGGYRFF